jgi:hypothetical protein
MYLVAEHSADPAKYDDGDAFIVFTGEDRLRAPGAPKVFGETAIPAGTYRVILDYSTRFKRIMPHILDVPDYDGIRFHQARKAVPVEFSTEGCVCVGLEKDSEDVYDCDPALAKVIALLQQAQDAHDPVWLTIPEVLHAPTQP